MRPCPPSSILSVTEQYSTPRPCPKPNTLSLCCQWARMSDWKTNGSCSVIRGAASAMRKEPNHVSSMEIMVTITSQKQEPSGQLPLTNTLTKPQSRQ
ncbi:hypothetical protein BaRGS_00012333 [Batillaria attramentaria]|uniref:Uncharacterized protein n=1 Tax=Batillaria attramentaria TaxID=370345 RepID=A0ABD0LAW5_9CAEN